jgi:hypothetical protein
MMVSVTGFAAGVLAAGLLATGLLATGLAAGLPATALAGLFFSALRAAGTGAGFARSPTEDFDFAETFFDLATALAMAF